MPALAEHRTVLIVTYNLFLCFPMSLLRRVSALRHVSYLSVIGNIYVLIVLALELPAYLAYHHTPEYTRSHPSFDMDMIKPGLGMMGGASYALTSFATHLAIPVAVAEMDNPNSRRLKKVNMTVTCLQIVILLSLAVLGYFTMRGEISPLVVARPALPGSSNGFMLVAAVLFTAAQLIALPLLLLPCRDSLRDLLALPDSQSFHLTATAALIIVPTLVAVADLGLDLILKIMATQVVWVCYFVPGILRVKLSKRSWTTAKNLGRLGLVLVVTVLILLNLAVTLQQELIV